MKQVSRLRLRLHRDPEWIGRRMLSAFCVRTLVLVGSALFLSGVVPRCVARFAWEARRRAVVLAAWPESETAGLQSGSSSTSGVRHGVCASADSRPAVTRSRPSTSALVCRRAALTPRAICMLVTVFALRQGPLK